MGVFALFAFPTVNWHELTAVFMALWLFVEFCSEAIRNLWINKCLKARGEESAIGFDLPEPEKE